MRDSFAPTLLAVAAAAALAVSTCHGNLLRFDGEVNVAVLVDLHHPNPAANDVDGEIGGFGDGGDECGPVNVDSVQQVIAAKWAVDVINNQSLPHELKIGLQLHDTCNAEDLTQRHLYHVISAARRDFRRPNSESPPMLGLIGVGDPSALSSTSGALHAFNIPLISTSPEHAERLDRDDHVLTTAPDMAGQARAIASLAALELDIKSLNLISSSHRATQIFLSEATTLGIRVPKMLELSHRQINDAPVRVENFLRLLSSNGDSEPVVAMIVNAREAVAIAEHLNDVSVPQSRPTWLVGSLGLDLRRSSSWRKAFHGGVFVEPHMPELKEFREYFVRSLRTPDHSLWPLIEEYKEEMFSCAGRSASPVTGSLLMPCDAISEEDIVARFQQDPQVSFVVKAISALAAAFRLVQLDHCLEDVRASCLREVHGDELHEDILGNLRKLSFSSMAPKSRMVDGSEHHFTRSGRLVANKQFIYLIDYYRTEEHGLESIGWYSEDEGLHLTTTLDASHDTTSLPLSAQLVSDDGDRDSRSISEKRLGNPQEPAKEVRDSKLETLPIFSYESFISRTWALVVVSVAIFGVVVSLWMMVYVFQKICDGTLNGNQLMGVLLLFGVMGLFSSVIPWLLPPNETVCAVRHFMHPLLLVICFAILLVKSMQLRSLVTIGVGGSLPQINQLVSLFFMITIQVVIAVEWYFATSPIGVRLIDGYPECNVSPPRFLLLHIYPAVLLMLSFFYALSVIKVKRNFNEGRWITCATLFIIPIFAAWPVVYYFAPVPFHDPSVAVSVLAVAGVLLAAIFLPKMNTISQQSHLKSCDMSRTNSDATVYTGFSDYLPFAGRSHFQQTQHATKGSSPAFPVYGYTTSQFVSPESRHRRRSPSKSRSSGSCSRRRHSAGFNGLNYVSPPTAAGANLKTFSDWSREYSPSAAASTNYHQRHHHHRHHNHNNHGSVDDDFVAPSAIYRSPPPTENHASTVASHGHYQNLVSTAMDEDAARERRRKSTSAFRSEASADRKSRSRSRRSQSQASASSRYVDYASYVERQRSRRHSRSPSDGMILTAAGLADLGGNGASNRPERMKERERSVDDVDDHVIISNGDTGNRVSQVILTH